MSFFVYEVMGQRGCAHARREQFGKTGGEGPKSADDQITQHGHEPQHRIEVLDRQEKEQRRDQATQAEQEVAGAPAGVDSVGIQASKTCTQHTLGHPGLSWDRGRRPCLTNDARKRQPDFMRTVFLHEMDAPNGYFLLVAPGATEFA
jgi:hypothetical protein